MPTLNTEVQHSLTQAEATEKLKGFLNGLREKHGHQVNDLQGEWNGSDLKFSFGVMGLSVQGNVMVLDRLTRVVVQLPFAALAFKGRIEQQIRDELTKALT